MVSKYTLRYAVLVQHACTCSLCITIYYRLYIFHSTRSDKLHVLAFSKPLKMFVTAAFRRNRLRTARYIEELLASVWSSMQTCVNLRHAHCDSRVRNKLLSHVNARSRFVADFMVILNTRPAFATGSSLGFVWAW